MLFLSLKDLTEDIIQFYTWNLLLSRRLIKGLRGICHTCVDLQKYSAEVYATPDMTK